MNAVRACILEHVQNQQKWEVGIYTQPTGMGIVRLHKSHVDSVAVVRAGGPVQSGIEYPVVVRFDNVNYAGVATNNFGLKEVEVVTEGGK